jgi:hypothetical protein
MLRVVIAGSRDFNHYPLLQEKLDFFLQHYPTTEIEIVSGTARGADRLGERYAQERGISLRKFPADWDRFGKKAGYLRNKQMAEYATHALLFWDGKSPGTKMMIELCQTYQLNYRIIYF